jgi:transposase
MKGTIQEGQMKKPRKQYTKEFKREAIRLCRQPGKGPSQVAYELGIERSLLYQWEKALSTEGADAFRGHGHRTAAESELESLRRRLRVVEEERDILKKAAIWFAKESE